MKKRFGENLHSRMLATVALILGVSSAPPALVLFCGTAAERGTYRSSESSVLLDQPVNFVAGNSIVSKSAESRCCFCQCECNSDGY